METTVTDVNAQIMYPFRDDPDNVGLYYIHSWTYLASITYVLKCHTFGALLVDQRGLNDILNVRGWETLIVARRSLRIRL